MEMLLALLAGAAGQDPALEAVLDWYLKYPYVCLSIYIYTYVHIHMHIHSIFCARERERREKD